MEINCKVLLISTEGDTDPESYRICSVLVRYELPPSIRGPLQHNCGTAQGYDLISASRGMTGIDNKRNIIVSATALGKTIEKIALVKEQGQTEIRFFREKCMRS